MAKHTKASEPALIVRRILLALLGVSLMMTLLGGLARLSSLTFFPQIIANHGLLMGGVLLPTLISLERAVALASWWSWGVPVVGLLAALSLVSGLGPAQIPLLGLALGLFAQHLALAQRRGGLDTQVSLLAIVVLITTDIRWYLSHNAPECALGWASFLILLIGAERIELSFLSQTRALGLYLILIILGAAALSNHPQGQGLGWLLFSSWLLRFDLARRNALRQAMAAYSARAVMLGYFWLAASGLQLCIWGLPNTGGLFFDRITHGVFVGFVLSMILAHGPIVMPAVARCGMQFTQWFYLPLVALHLSLLLRWLGWRELGATGNILSLAFFGIQLLIQSRRGQNPWLKPA